MLTACLSRKQLTSNHKILKRSVITPGCGYNEPTRFGTKKIMFLIRYFIALNVYTTRIWLSPYR